MEETTQEHQPIVVAMEAISKSFGAVLALDKVDLELREGEILALLGENGSGKTTLMNVLFGIYRPDHGQIRIHGKPVHIKNPKDAAAYRIGMVHQHVKLIDILSVAENIILGMPGGMRLKRKQVAKEVAAIAERYGFDIHPNDKVYELSIAQKQMVEIVKVLYRGADVLILDEPTAVLTPQEIARFFTVLRLMRDEGKSIVIITHKMEEVLSISDRVSVLRKGQYVGSVPTAEADVQSLSERMVGHRLDLQIDRPHFDGPLRLKVEGLHCPSPEGKHGLSGIDFELRAGEILGVAGISGSGQKELCEAICGLYKIDKGRVLFYDVSSSPENLVGQSPNSIMQKGISLAFVPEDRLGMGLVPSMGMVDNVMLKNYRSNKGPFVNRARPAGISKQLVSALDIDTKDLRSPISHLSGGNVQKILVGREIEFNPKLLIVAYPVRGLDINSSYTIYRLLNKQKEKGVAIIFIGEDLDVLMAISDRLMVLSKGRMTGIVDPKSTSKQDLGLLMSGEGASA